MIVAGWNGFIDDEVGVVIVFGIVTDDDVIVDAVGFTVVDGCGF